jgi:hypothetical protein
VGYPPAQVKTAAFPLLLALSGCAARLPPTLHDPSPAPLPPPPAPAASATAIVAPPPPEVTGIVFI